MSNLDFQSRGAYPQPTAEDGVRAPPGEVVVYLPGYENDRVLLRFWAYSVDKVQEPYVNYQFAYDMCMAMTDNVRPGVFTKERAPNSEKAEAERGGLLAKEKYFFHHVGSDTSTVAEKYLVLRSFRDLNFRPEVVGAHWREAVPWEGNSEGYKLNACSLSGEDVMQEELLERGAQETLAMTREGGAVTMNGFESGQYKSQQLRNTSHPKSESGGSRSRKRDRGPEDAENKRIASEGIDHDDMKDEWSDSGVDVHEHVRGRRRTQLHEDITRLDAKRKRQAERGVEGKHYLFWRMGCKSASVLGTHEESHKKRRKHN